MTALYVSLDNFAGKFGIFIDRINGAEAVITIGQDHTTHLHFTRPGTPLGIALRRDGDYLRRVKMSCHHAAFYGKLPPIKTMKKLIWLLPLLIILMAMLVAVEIKGSSPTHEITINYGNLYDTSGRLHSVLLVLHPDGSVTWRDMTRHIR